MKSLLVKWMTMLMIAAIMLTSTAFMEEIPVDDTGTVDTQGEVEEQSENANVELDNAADITIESGEQGANELPENGSSENIILETVDEYVPESEDAEIELEDPESVVEETEEEYSLEFMEAQDAIEEADESLMAGSFSVGINSTNFPDSGFRQYVSEYIDINPSDGYLSDSEIAKVEKINFSEVGFGVRGSRGIHINNLKGIENFYNLDYLGCRWCGLDSLDISKNAKLQFLDCTNNSLTSLDVSQNTNLLVLICWDNNIAQLDISALEKILPCVKAENKQVGLWKDYEYYEYIGDDDYRYHDDLVGNQPMPYVGYDKTTTLVTEKASSNSNNTSGTTDTSIETPSIISISVSKNTKRTVSVGTVYQIDLNGKTGKKFRSSKKKIATVDSSGIITPMKAGRTKITFKVGRRYRTLTLKVVDPTVPTRISLNMSGTNSVNQGDTVTLSAILPEGTYSGIKWKSNHKSIATVSNGVVTFKKKGTVTITATTTRGKKQAKVKFKVTKYDASKDLSNYGWRTVTGVTGDNKLTFRRTHTGGYMSNHRFANGEQIFVNLTWREGGDAIAYDNGTFGYVQAKYIDW